MGEGGLRFFMAPFTQRALRKSGNRFFEKKAREIKNVRALGG